MRVKSYSPSWSRNHVNTNHDFFTTGVSMKIYKARYFLSFARISHDPDLQWSPHLLRIQCAAWPRVSLFSHRSVHCPAVDLVQRYVEPGPFNFPFNLPDVVDDTVRKLPHRKPAPTLAPRCAELGMGTKQGECSFELRDEGKPDFGIAFAGIEMAPSVSSRSASGLTEGFI